jgi:hypothetical protein
MYYYWGFGLKIASEIKFPELLTFEFATPPDVHIIFGITPVALNGNDVVNLVGVSISATEYLLKFINIANYYVTNGNKIIVKPLPGADEKSIRLFLLSNAMAALLHQRDVICLHASAIEYNDGIILFCGQTGSGKSTAVSMLQQKGHKIFSDDVCVLKPNDNGVIAAFSSYPMVKLWKDGFAKLGIEIPNEIYRVRPQLPKYACFYHEQFEVNAKPVKQIYILNKINQITELQIKKLSPLLAFSELQKNTYRKVQIDAMKKRDIHFKMMTSLSTTTSVYQVTRSEYGNSIAQIADLVELNLPLNGE